MKAALLDLLMLSRCKELMLTPFSTFSAVAAGIGNLIPHFITRDEGYWHALSLYGEHGTGCCREYRDL
jgi:hypothetical protein